MGRRSRQRQGVILHEGIKNGGLDIFQSRRTLIRHRKRAAARRLFFFCRRPADTSFIFAIDYKFLIFPSKVLSVLLTNIAP